MKVKLKKTLIFIALLAVVLTNGFFGKLEKTSTQDSQNNFVSAQQEYRVVVKEPQTSLTPKSGAVTVVQNSSAHQDCNFKAPVQNRNYFQDQATVDLNQPFNCFSLKLSRTQVLTQALEVKALVQPQTRVVVIELPSGRFSSNYAEQSIPEGKPMAVFEYSIFHHANRGFESKVIISIIEVSPVSQDNIFNKTIIELQNFRC